MKTRIIAFIVTVAALGAVSLSAQGYTQLRTTTLSAAVTTTTATQVIVGSATGITANSTSLWIDWELMAVTGVSGTTISVRRGANGTRPQPHASSETVIVVAGQSTVDADPVGACTLGVGLAATQPIINTTNGNVWTCRSSEWKATNVAPLTYNSITTSP